MQGWDDTLTNYWCLDPISWPFGFQNKYFLSRWIPLRVRVLETQKQVQIPFYLVLSSWAHLTMKSLIVFIKSKYLSSHASSYFGLLAIFSQSYWPPRKRNFTQDSRSMAEMHHIFPSFTYTDILLMYWDLYISSILDTPLQWHVLACPS